jgi:phosphoglycerate dehydrogenase-like enzyme
VVRVAVLPHREPWADAAVAAAGSVPSAVEQADALVWVGESPAGLDAARRAGRSLRWIQLPAAGVDGYLDLLDPAVRWTSMKGIYGAVVAEHALALALAGFRRLHEAVGRRGWDAPVGRTLHGARAVVLGAGSIGSALVPLLTALGSEVTVLRRGDEPVDGAALTTTLDRRFAVLAHADLVVVALALTPQTEGVIGGAELAALPAGAWLVNVGRGRHVDTPALVDALQAGRLGGAALDVTDPEPLPDGHPLWSLPNCIVTPHVASPTSMVEASMAARVRSNLLRFASGQPLDGEVDVELGY